MYPFDIKILASLTWQRAWNLMKVAVSYLLSRWFGIVTVSGRPPALSIEPTNLCNLQCPQCPTGVRGLTRASGFIDLDVYRHIIDELQRELLFLLLYFQGEPFLHKELCAMIRYARDRRIYTGTSTNGHYFRDDEPVRTLVDSGLNVLIVSVDGADQATYEQYRKNGRLDIVLQGLDRIVRARNAAGSSMRIYVQFLVFRHNEHQIEDMRRITAASGADRLLLKSAQIYDHTPGAAGWMPEDPRYRRYVDDDGRLTVNGRAVRGCKKLWTSPVITVDGRVVPCCFDKDAGHSFGQIGNVSTFDEIWNSEETRNFRRALVANRNQIDICRNCTEGLRIFH